MKLKYYLNGFGAGVLFATIVLSIAFYINSGKGQIQDQNVDMTTTTEQQEITTETVKESESIDETSTEESIAETTPEETTTKEEIEETSTEQITEETQEITTKPEDQIVSLKILSGMTSDAVARKLEELGIIQSAQDFDNYLIRKGYDNKIHPGNYEISVGADYETILNQICR